MVVFIGVNGVDRVTLGMENLQSLLGHGMHSDDGNLFCLNGSASGNRIFVVDYTVKGDTFTTFLFNFFDELRRRMPAGK